MQVSDLKLLLVGGLVAAAIVIESLLPLAVLGIFLVWVASALFTRRLGARTPADFGILALVLLLPLNAWVSPLPEKSLLQIYRLLTGIALFYAIVEACTDLRRLRLAIAGVALAGLVLVLMAPFGVEWAKEKLAFIPSALFESVSLRLSDAIHPNVMAGYLLIFLPPVLATSLYNWRGLRPAERLLYSIAALLMVLVLVLTKARGALLGLIFAGVILVALRWRRGWLAVAFLGLAGIAFLLAVGPEIVLTPLISAEYGVSTLEGRVEIWSRGLYMVRDFPLTGIGIGLFGNLADTLYPFFQYEPGSVPHAHNLFLQIAVDLGAPGLVAWLAIFFSIAALTWSVYRKAVQRGMRQGWAAALSAGLLASHAALFIQGLLDAVTWGMVRPAPFVWGLWGLAVACWNLAD